MQFLWHAKTEAHFYEQEGLSLFLFGHAYNPFTMQANEQEILAYLAAGWEHDFDARLDELTGIFVLGVIAEGSLTFYTDPSGIQSACQGVIDGHFYLSSHAQLVGDVCKLEMDAYVKELIAYKWYGRVMGPYLPADLTPFSNVRRVLPNQAYSYQTGGVTHKRFYPVRELTMYTTKEQYEQAIAMAADILRRNMQLVAQKWEHPQISLTGGIDSNTTFAAANGRTVTLHSSAPFLYLTYTETGTTSSESSAAFFKPTAVTTPSGLTVTYWSFSENHSNSASCSGTTTAESWTLSPLTISSFVLSRRTACTWSSLLLHETIEIKASIAAAQRIFVFIIFLNLVVQYHANIIFLY
jgi:hypothetical protein